MKSNQELKEILKNLYTNLLSGNLTVLSESLEDNVVLKDPISSPWGGTWEGKEQVVAALPFVSQNMGLAGAEVRDILIDNLQGVGVVTVKQMNKHGETKESSLMEYFKFNEEGKIIEIMPHFFDINPMIEFLNQ